MITVASVVENIVIEDQENYRAFVAGLLNLSNYARKILVEVEERTMKEVGLRSIVVALSRLQRIHQKTKGDLVSPNVKIDGVTILASVACLACVRTDENMRIIQSMQSKTVPSNEVRSFTMGVGELGVIASGKVIDSLRDKIEPSTLLLHRNDLSALTIKISQENYHIVNLVHALFAKFARVNLDVLEVFTTYTEITIVIKKSDLKSAVKQFISTI